jgi:hypothetical protein
MGSKYLTNRNYRNRKLPKVGIHLSAALLRWVIGCPADHDIIPPNETADRRISQQNA